ncbi:MAG: sulfate adenylyltransferase, partial [Eudoraea sp.]|nr:sulfate adenylyltransferase [Eudoraea sp.]NNJ39296.1 sulfate adenylyltransferase [Eudoraea sp.]
KTEEFHDFRGFAGKVYGGSFKVGDKVTVLPSGNQSKIKGIHFFDKAYTKAEVGNSVTFTLEDEINITRGDMLVKTGQLPQVEREIEATVCWMDTKPLLPGSKYILQHNTNRVLSKIDAIRHTIATDYSGNEPANSMVLNEIGETSLKLSKPIYFDAYRDNKTNGAFILIDPQTNTTAGVGFIN